MNSTEPTSARQRLLELRVKQKQARKLSAPLTRRDDAISRSSGSDPLPLTHTQRRAWFLAQLDPNSTAYNEARAYKLSGVIEVAALRESFRALLKRHEILRTTYASVGDQPMQFVHDDPAVDFELIDLVSRLALKDMDVLGRTLAEAAREPFDLSRGPLVRFRVIHLDENEYVLLRVWHHIVTDGWSSGVFEREVSALYNAEVAGQPAQLPALPIQYADYALWQRQWLSGAVLEQQLCYWKKQLADLATLELPTDRPRPALQSYRGARLEVGLADALGEGLKALGRKEGATLFMAGLAAFKVLLYRYSGTADIAIGTPIAGRGRTELEGLIGFFANTLVLRTDLSGVPTFRQVLARVRESALGAYTHQDLPFEKLVEELAPVRDLSRNPLFQVCFALQNMPGRGLTLQGLEVERVELTTEHAKFDLSLDLRERDGQLRMSFEYCTDLFERGTIERLAEHFGVLLGSILADPDQSIETLALMSEAERHRILVQWNDTAALYPKDKTLAELFEAQVRRTPDALALIHEDQRLSYTQLNARANQLAHYLRARGVGPDVPVAICMERSPALIVGLLGIVKAGGAYVPVDPELPAERVAFMLEDSGAQFLLTQDALLERLPAGACQRLCMDRDWNEIAAHGSEDPPNQSTPRQLVYLMYTSGSTGTPKGVAIRQQSVIRLVARPNYMDISPNDTIAQVSSVAFDAATFEIWGALLNGARLAILSRDIVLSPPRFVAALEAHHVTCMFLTTALFNRVSIEMPDAFRSLRHVLFGGEACDPNRVKAVMKAGPPARLVHVYGPTETTTFATYHVVRESEERATIPIGRPISETQVLLLDPRGQLVPPGVVGEIHIGGLGVAAGYLNRLAETQARFVPHPFEPVSGILMYRTGDLARWLADGSIEFVGRNDDQVKIRGFRIEPGEIGAVLATHPDVRACHVEARRQSTGDVGLTAYVVVDDSDGERLSPAALRRFLASRLPAYMIPAAFVALGSLPLTINGKVDTRALPDPAASDALERAESVAPRDSFERTMCRVWSEVLGIERIGLDDNFFEIGGHSLLAAKLFARLDEELGRSPALGILFIAPTVRLLADHYRDSAMLVDEPSRALVPLRSEGTRPPLYFLPGVFGNVVGYVDFVRELGPDQPIYGLQSIGLTGRAEPFGSIEAMAKHYLSEVRAHQPRGPYALVGACFGATVAYEMARQLMAAGEVVAFLGLIAPTAREGDEADQRKSRAPRVVKRAVALGNLMRERLRAYLMDMRGLSPAARLSYLMRKVHSLSGTVVKPHAFNGVQRELNQREVYHANLHALDSFLRRPLKGALVAFEILEIVEAGLPEDRPPIDWESYWQGPLTWHVLPGKDSGDMLAGANARAVATLLTGRLRAAFEQASTMPDPTTVKGYVV